MKTTIINLFGGPGTGKSTSAAFLYYYLKSLNKNVELVREYVKDWAWEKRPIGPFDQFYFMGKQMRRESLLYGKVDYIVTDSPIIMNDFYAHEFCDKDVAVAINMSVSSYLSLAESEGHKHYNLFLQRSKEYNPAGRYQSEMEAIKFDNKIKDLLVNRGWFDSCCTTDEDVLKVFINDIISNENKKR